MPKSARPRIRSSAMLKGLATAVTFLSASGMTAFAATHVQNTAAPLQPSAPPTTAVAAVAIPAPTATPRRRTTVTSGVTTTTTTAVTNTHRS